MNTFKQQSFPTSLVEISKILDDDEMQVRAEMSDDKVMDYKAAYERGDNIPPVVLFRDPIKELYRLADGWHRRDAQILLGRTHIEAIIKEGGKREAKFYALCSNAEHGLDRSPADRRKIIRVLFLEYPEWRERPDREIARQLKFRHHDLVSTVRKEMIEAKEIEEVERKVTRGTQTFTQKDKEESSGGFRQIETQTPQTSLTYLEFNSGEPSKTKEEPCPYCDLKRRIEGVGYCSKHPKEKASAGVSQSVEASFEKSGELDAKTLLPKKNGGVESSTPPKKVKLVKVKCPKCQGLPTKTLCKMCWAKGFVELELIRDEANGNGEKNQHYNTPPEIRDPLKQLTGEFGLDPCHNDGSILGALKTINETQDGLSDQWDWAALAKGHLIPVNPPYNNISPWVDRVILEAAKGANEVLIVPNRSDADWHHKASESCKLMAVVKGRVNFLKNGEPDKSPTEATILFYWGTQPGRFAAIAKSQGWRVTQDLSADMFSGAVATLKEEEAKRRQVVLPMAEPQSEAKGETIEEIVPDVPNIENTEKEGEPDLWLPLVLKQLRDCTTREEFDALYKRIARDASDDEVLELVKHHDELRAKLPSANNVKPEILARTIAPQMPNCIQCKKPVNNGDPKAFCVPGTPGGYDAWWHFECKPVPIVPNKEEPKDELLHFEVWLKEGVICNSKGGYALFEEEVREVTLTPKQFANWQKDDRLRFRTLDWLEQGKADLAKCENLIQLYPISDGLIDLTVTAEDRQAVRTLVNEWKQNHAAAPKAPRPTRKPGKNEEKKTSKPIKSPLKKKAGKK